MVLINKAINEVTVKLVYYGPALSGKTTTGRAVDAMASLAYINPPTGLSAAVQ